MLPARVPGRATTATTSVALLLMAAVVAAVVGAGLLAVPPAADASSDIRIRTLHPAPGELVQDGRVQISAGVETDVDLSDVQVAVNGVRLESTQIEAPTDRDTTITASADVEDGEHHVEMVVTAVDGSVAQRGWSFGVTGRSAERLSGPDRFATAVDVSQAVFEDDGTAPAAVLARAEEFADALAGAPLAAALGGPLLLSTGDGLPSQTTAELERVLEADATVHLLGGEAALGEEVADDVEALGFEVERHAGDGRIATAATVAGALPTSSAAVIAAAGSFPDALAASAPAAIEGMPVLLTGPDELPAATAAVLERRGVTHVTVVGGTAAVSDDVVADVDDIVGSVQRVAGETRYATAVEVMDTFFDDVEGMSLASGMDFPDSLAGTTHAVAAHHPLLLTATGELPEETEDAIRAARPHDITLYGGTAAIRSRVATAAVQAAIAGRGAPDTDYTWPWQDQLLPRLTEARVEFDIDVDPVMSSLYVEVDGVELAGDVQMRGADTVTLAIDDVPEDLAVDQEYEGRMVLAAASADGGVIHEEVEFTYIDPDAEYASVGGLALELPSEHVEMIGYHESGHRGAQQQDDHETGTPSLIMPSRGRGTPPRSAADVVSDPDLPIVAPVSGEVKRAESYWLYGQYYDELIVIEPDGFDRMETVMLHVDGLMVAEGDQVTAGETEIADGPRQFPFVSQVDRFSSDENWAHTHIEVVDLDAFNAAGRECVAGADARAGAPVCLESFLSQ